MSHAVLCFLTEHDKNEALSARVLEAEGYLEVVSVEREGLLSKVAALEEECQERCRLSNEWFENLKVSQNIQTTVLYCIISSLNTYSMDLLYLEACIVTGPSHNTV